MGGKPRRPWAAGALLRRRAAHPGAAPAIPRSRAAGGAPMHSCTAPAPRLTSAHAFDPCRRRRRCKRCASTPRSTKSPASTPRAARTTSPPPSASTGTARWVGRERGGGAEGAGGRAGARALRARACGFLPPVALTATCVAFPSPGCAAGERGVCAAEPAARPRPPLNPTPPCRTATPRPAPRGRAARPLLQLASWGCDCWGGLLAPCLPPYTTLPPNTVPALSDSLPLGQRRVCAAPAPRSAAATVYRGD